METLMTIYEQNDLLIAKHCVRARKETSVLPRPNTTNADDL
jgi:hypothetical protein